jgi:SAM-dependent methyltransferase
VRESTQSSRLLASFAHDAAPAFSRMPVASRLTGRDDRAALLGELAPLFDDRFVRSCDLYEPYVEALAREIFAACGLERVFAAPCTVDAAIAAAGLDAAVARVPVAWLCALLARAGQLAQDGDRYGPPGPHPARDAAALRAVQAAHDPACLPAYDLAAYAAGHYPAVLAGRVSGEAALAEPAALDLWSSYFSNANALYGVSNAVGARAASRALGACPGAVLELGGGLGSGAEALLAQAPRESITTYQFTDASPLFLRRAKRALQPRHADRALAFAALDIDAPFAAAGIAPGSVALVYAVNVLHVALDLGATLAEIRAALQPGGALVFAECVRPRDGLPLHEELVFNLLERFRSPRLDPVWRPNGGFLTPGQWRTALAENGFRDVAVMPDVAAIHDAYPSFAVGAVTARPA